VIFDCENGWLLFNPFEINIHPFECQLGYLFGKVFSHSNSNCYQFTKK